MHAQPNQNHEQIAAITKHPDHDSKPHYLGLVAGPPHQQEEQNPNEILQPDSLLLAKPGLTSKKRMNHSSQESDAEPYQNTSQVLKLMQIFIR